MPLELPDGTLIDKWDRNTVDKVFECEAKQFAHLTPVQVSRGNGLCFLQRELGVLKPNTVPQPLEWVGSDEATTCQVVFLHDEAFSTLLVSHIDSPYAFSQIEARFPSCENGEAKLTLHLFGGYEDEEGISRVITNGILSSAINSTRVYCLKSLFIGKLNTKKQESHSVPIFSSFAINLRSKKCVPAIFESHEPAADVRGFRVMFGPDTLYNVYSESENAFVIDPFPVRIDYPHMLLKNVVEHMDDEQILTYFSTSPRAEPPNFARDMRSKFKMALDVFERKLKLFENGTTVYRFDGVSWVIHEKEPKEMKAAV